MVSTRSSRTSRKQSPVDSNMEDTKDKKEETVEKKEEVEDTTPTDKNEEEDKNDIGCKQCLEEGKPIETREVETEYDKPDRIFKYMQGFIKRVIICSAFILLCKTVWPRIQPMVWPETPTKVRAPPPSLSSHISSRRENSTFSMIGVSGATSAGGTTS